jgi:hypothetical protein
MLKLILSTTIGSALTYFLNINLSFGPFIASGLVGLVATKLFPKFAAPIYAASFVSMSSLEVLPSITLSFFSGLFTGLIYLSVQKMFVGVGGKLGAIAFFTVLIATWSRLPVYSYNPLTLFETLYLIFTSCFGAGLTYYISMRFKQNPVFSSSVVVLTFALIGNIFLRFDDEIVAAVTCGSYAGMSSCEVITNIKKMYLVGLVAGIILFLSWPLFCGVGGKLGLVAFLAVFLSKLVIGCHESRSSL